MSIMAIIDDYGMVMGSGYVFLLMIVIFVEHVMYVLCTGYENYSTGLCTSWELWTIMGKLWALSTIIDDYEAFFKKTHNQDIMVVNFVEHVMYELCTDYEND